MSVNALVRTFQLFVNLTLYSYLDIPSVFRLKQKLLPTVQIYQMFECANYGCSLLRLCLYTRFGGCGGPERHQMLIIPNDYYDWA